MVKKVVFVHTIISVMNQVNKLGAHILPGVEFFHILDEVMLEHIRFTGRPGLVETNRLKSHVESAAQIGASAVVVTCSMLSSNIDEIRLKTDIPILKIDEVLAEKAVAQGKVIGVLATNKDTLKPSADIIYQEAKRVGKTVTVIPTLVDSAFDAVRRGDLETHNHLVKQSILEISPLVDVIVLAQASMASVLDILPVDERVIPVLSSPHLVLEQAKQVIREI
jgi:Asp/Glu/hydantoin racemase